MKLTGEEVQKAWDDYNSFLNVMRDKSTDPETKLQEERNNHLRKQLEAAFRMGFSEGFRANEKASEGWSIAPPRTNRYTRSPRVFRTDEVVEREESEVLSILQAYGRPMPLALLIRALKKRGVIWNNGNAAGHMRTMIDRHKNVRRVSRGIYACARRERV